MPIRVGDSLAATIDVRATRSGWSLIRGVHERTLPASAGNEKSSFVQVHWVVYGGLASFEAFLENRDCSLYTAAAIPHNALA